MLGVNQRHIGQIVDTAGWITPVWAADETRIRRIFTDYRLPPGLRFILKHIDNHQRAFVYRMDTGVLMAPATLFDPWAR